MAGIDGDGGDSVWTPAEAASFGLSQQGRFLDGFAVVERDALVNSVKDRLAVLLGLGNRMSNTTFANLAMSTADQPYLLDTRPVGNHKPLDIAEITFFQSLNFMVPNKAFPPGMPPLVDWTYGVQDQGAGNFPVVTFLGPGIGDHSVPLFSLRSCDAMIAVKLLGIANRYEGQDGGFGPYSHFTAVLIAKVPFGIAKSVWMEGPAGGGAVFADCPASLFPGFLGPRVPKAIRRLGGGNGLGVAGGGGATANY